MITDRFLVDIVLAKCYILSHVMEVVECCLFPQQIGLWGGFCKVSDVSVTQIDLYGGCGYEVNRMG